MRGGIDIVETNAVQGTGMRFLPAYCMMNLAHTGVVNQLFARKEGF